jgi:hypothetical protein
LSGKTDVFQTTAYRNHFVYKADKPAYVIYLTKERHPADNALAIEPFAKVHSRL